MSELDMRLKQLDKLEKKIQLQEDIREIEKLTYDYVDYLVTVQWDNLVECFTEDAKIEIGVAGLRKGKKEITKLFKEEIGTRHIGKEMVFIVHPKITVDGNKAKGNWFLYFQFTEATHIETFKWVQGPYDISYEKINGQWKISCLKWEQRLGPVPKKLLQIYGKKDD